MSRSTARKVINTSLQVLAGKVGRKVMKAKKERAEREKKESIHVASWTPSGTPPIRTDLRDSGDPMSLEGIEIGDDVAMVTEEGVEPTTLGTLQGITGRKMALVRTYSGQTIEVHPSAIVKTRDMGDDSPLDDDRNDFSRIR